MHFGGYAAAVDRLAELCAARGLILIEDAAHSPMATLGDRGLGTFGLAGAFSFFSNKVLAAGEGGLLATDDPEVAAFARSRRSHAMTRGSWERHLGHAEDYDVARARLQLSHRRAAGRAALVSPAAPGGRRGPPTRADPSLPAAAEPRRRPHRPVQRRGRRRVVLLCHAGDAGGSRASGRAPHRAARKAQRPDEPVLSGRPRVHRLPQRDTPTCPFPAPSSPRAAR